MKKFLRAGLFFACLASSSVFTAGEAPGKAQQKVMGGLIGLMLGSNIVAKQHSIISLAALIGTLCLSPEMEPLKNMIGCGLFSRLAFEIIKNKVTSNESTVKKNESTVKKNEYVFAKKKLESSTIA